ncbi:MAG: IS630 transposase-related protein [Defluviitaleaceae bacterium]|nr:IS630 transposase-related protein [Defluviitaleaceae bacterium]
MAYDKKYREAAIRYKEAGHTLKEVQEVFKIHASTYYQCKKLKEETGNVKAKKGLTKKSKKIELIKLKEYIENNNDAYSPDFNLIEILWANIKKVLKSRLKFFNSFDEAFLSCF